ncbi:B3 domain-containing protein REM10-like isoform X2 [Macadamia integrifolia]|uniref:B3 domain-containing protein REM10-like isoform X2 n=1 Tax=Macadamia integrifolia TaxID=60698 RepID=UPI001C4F456C|nr:B3 domain-containing protein REM10-like isoform X2 [Macadamia integrifolia]
MAPELQFFKPILPPFQQLSIPKAFLKHLVDEMCEEGVGEATLRNHRCASKSWRVKVKGFCFTVGWDDFIRDNDLGFGDFVVFAYKGAMVFDVKVFDRSSCEKEYHHPPATVVKREFQNQQEKDYNRLKEEEIKISSPLSGQFTTPCIGPKATGDAFEVLITENKIRKASSVGVPKDFAVANGLIGKIFQAIFRDERGNSWCVRLNQDSGRVRMGCGWCKFVSGNYLKEGDTCVFKLVNCGKICSKVEDTIVLDVTTSTSSSSSFNDGDGFSKNSDQIEIRPNNPFFLFSLRSYILKWSRLDIPRPFVRESGLIGIKRSFTTTLRDGKGRSWRVLLRNSKTSKAVFYLRGDWVGISAVNGLKEGDTCKIELIRRGKLQVVEFRMLL